MTNYCSCNSLQTRFSRGHHVEFVLHKSNASSQHAHTYTVSWANPLLWSLLPVSGTYLLFTGTFLITAYYCCEQGCFIDRFHLYSSRWWGSNIYTSVSQTRALSGRFTVLSQWLLFSSPFIANLSSVNISSHHAEYPGEINRIDVLYLIPEFSKY